MRVTTAANPKPAAIARDTAVSVSGSLPCLIPRTPKMMKTSELVPRRQSVRRAGSVCCCRRSDRRSAGEVKGYRNEENEKDGRRAGRKSRRKASTPKHKEDKRYEQGMRCQRKVEIRIHRSREQVATAKSSQAIKKRRGKALFPMRFMFAPSAFRFPLRPEFARECGARRR